MNITRELKNELFAKQRAISTHEDLGGFLEFLEGKYDGGLIDKKDLGEFIGEASEIFESLDAEEMRKGQPTWTLVGEVILAAVLRD